MELAKAKNQKRGVFLTKENSDKLFDSSLEIANNKNYGHAISLLILSSEEIIKSFALCLEFFLGDKSEVKKIIKESTSKSIDAYLFNHSEKHKLASAILFDLKNIPSFFKYVLQSLPKPFNKISSVVLLKSAQINEIESVINNLQEFNDLKNRGFYVDRKDELWVSPSDLSDNNFENCRKDVQLIRDIFSEKINLLLEFTDDEWESVYSISSEKAFS
jgi:AbiV family abortive infection protein